MVYFSNGYATNYLTISHLGKSYLN